MDQAMVNHHGQIRNRDEAEVLEVPKCRERCGDKASNRHESVTESAGERADLYLRTVSGLRSAVLPAWPAALVLLKPSRIFYFLHNILSRLADLATNRSLRDRACAVFLALLAA